MSAESSTAVTPPSPPPLLPPENVAAAPATGVAFKIRWGFHLLLMAALPIVAGTSGMAKHASGPALTHTALGMLKSSGYQVLFVAIPLAVAWLISRASKDDLLLRWRPGYWVVPLGAVYSVVIRVTAGFVLGFGILIFMQWNHASMEEVKRFLIANRPQIEKLVDAQALTENRAYFWLAVAVVSPVLGGLREELWRSWFLAGLRSLWPRAFGSNGGGIAGAAIAALFFGAAHLPQGPLAAALVTVVGFFLGVIMTMHRSIWPSVVAHGLFDASSIAMLAYLPQIQEMVNKAA